MRVLVTGAAGQVGRELVELCLNSAIDVIACTRDQIDISNFQQVSEVIKQYSPTVVVNAAAYTAVDKAETEKEKAWQVNSEGAKNLAIICSQLHISLIHISTDYVFNGEKSSPYSETDQTNPTSEYGKSKLAGELAIKERCSDFYILRTSWVFGQYGNNFVKTMLRLAKKDQALRVVADQKGTPTPALMIAEAIIALIKDNLSLANGIYHLGGLPEVTWYEFARSIIETASKLGLCNKVDIEPITTADFPTPAKRPKNSSLSSQKLFSGLKITQSHWQEYLERVLSEKSNGLSL
ncbi:MAG: dTDP-4-dehydrorhamnose reductase [Cellvibrionaceae bacterium]